MGVFGKFYLNLKNSKGQSQLFVYLDHFHIGMNLISRIILTILSHRPFSFSAISYVFVKGQIFFKNGTKTRKNFNSIHSISFISCLVNLLVRLTIL